MPNNKPKNNNSNYNNQNQNQNRNSTNPNVALTATPSGPISIISEKTHQEVLNLQKELTKAASHIKNDTLTEHERNAVTKIIAEKRTLLQNLEKEKNQIYTSGAKMLLAFERDKTNNRSRLNEVTKLCTKLGDQLKTDLRLKQRG